MVLLILMNAELIVQIVNLQVPEIKRFSYEEFELLDEVTIFVIIHFNINFQELKSRKIRPEDFYLDDELVSRNVAVEEREKMLEEMAAK